MRDITRFLARYYWDDAYETLLGSAIVFLVSMFFANFDRIFPLYNPVVTNLPNGNFGIIGIFRVIVWPALVSTVAALVCSVVKIWYKIRGRKNRKENQETSSS